MTQLPDFPEIPEDRCDQCPTYHSHLYGHDPESYDILTNEAWCREHAVEFADLLCPWRKAPCVVYPIELQWAIACWDAGVMPPVKLHPVHQKEYEEWHNNHNQATNGNKAIK